MYKNVTGQKIAVYAVDSTGAAKTGDAANITAYVNKDGGGAVQSNDVNPTETSATNMPGEYLFDMTQAETNADLVTLVAKSSTSGVTLTPVSIYTRPQLALTSGLPTGMALEATLADMKGAGYSNTTDTLEKIRDAIDAVPSSTGVPTCYEPTSATRVTGTDEGGTVADILSRDGVYFSTGEVNSGTLLEVTVTRSTSDITEIPSLVELHGRYEGGAGHLITARAWNFVSSAWDAKGSLLSRTTDFEYTFTLNGSVEYHDAATGEMRFNFLHSAGTGIPTHRLHIDYMCFQKVGTTSVLESSVAAIKSVTDNIAFTFSSGTYYVKGDTQLWGGASTAIPYLNAAIDSRAPAGTALSTAQWTNTKAGYLDAAISSRSTFNPATTEMSAGVSYNAALLEMAMHILETQKGSPLIPAFVEWTSVVGSYSTALSVGASIEVWAADPTAFYPGFSGDTLVGTLTSSGWVTDAAWPVGGKDMNLYLTQTGQMPAGVFTLTSTAPSLGQTMTHAVKLPSRGAGQGSTYMSWDAWGRVIENFGLGTSKSYGFLSTDPGARVDGYADGMAPPTAIENADANWTRTPRSLTDKTGYYLADDQTNVTIGSVEDGSGGGGTVTADVDNSPTLQLIKNTVIAIKRKLEGR
jgi:hypothetical protein